MRLNGIPPIVRAAGSIALILTGILLLGLVWLPGGDDGSDNESSIAADAPTATPEPECPDGLRLFEQTAMQFTICIPTNLVYYRNATSESLDDLDLSDPRFDDNFVLANLGWINPWPSDLPSDPAVAPLNLRFQLITAQASYIGCDVHSETPDENGIRSCSDTFALIEGQVVAETDGFIHLYKALVPTRFVPEGQTGAAGSWSLMVTVDTPTATWPAQEPLVEQLIESIEPY